MRAISSRIDLAANSEDLASRIDHDNASVATAASYEPHGVYLFVALETSREVAVLDAFSRAGACCASTSAARRRASRFRPTG